MTSRFAANLLLSPPSYILYTLVITMYFANNKKPRCQPRTCDAGVFVRHCVGGGEEVCQAVESDVDTGGGVARDGQLALQGSLIHLSSHARARKN